MRILELNKKDGLLVLIPESKRDLWHVYKLISKGDKVSGRTFRVVKFETEEEKKPVRLTISAEETAYRENEGVLRIRGKILSGTPQEFIQVGRYHSIDLKPGEKIEISKEKFDPLLEKRLEIAEREANFRSVLVLLIDDHDAKAYKVEPDKIRLISSFSFKGSPSDKEYSSEKNKYYSEIIEFLVSRKEERILVAGPGFAKEELHKLISSNPGLSGKEVYLSSASNVEQTGINELVRRGDIRKLVGSLKMAEEREFLDIFLKNLGKDNGLSAYGEKSVARALDYGAVETLAVSEDLVYSPTVEELLSKAENLRAKVIFFERESENYETLKNFGGIAANLRFRVE